MKLFKTSSLFIALLISLLSQAAPAKSTVVDDLRVLNDEAAKIYSKIKQGHKARDNAHAAGEAKLTCDFHAGIIIYMLDLRRVHNEKADIFKAHGMTESRNKELKAMAALDKLGEFEFAEFNQRCR